MILTYLSESPDAEDTLEGIVEWWLLEEEIKWRTADVRRALSELTQTKLLLEKCGLDGRSRYRVNRDRLMEIRKMLQDRAEAQEPQE